MVSVSGSGRARGALALTLVAAAALFAQPALAPEARAQSVADGPPSDPFFHADPARLAAARPGEVINSRPVTMPAFLGYQVTEIAYRSTDTHDAPILATATVVRRPGLGKDAPVLSYQHYLNALGQNCAPTQTLTAPTLETLQDNAMVFLRLQIDKGQTVIIPDHLGPQAAYPGGQLSGRITLDSMRAVRDYPAFDSHGSRFAAAGYSGGGISTAWTGLLHKTYAPDVDLVGVAQGGVPTDMTTMARFLGNLPHPAFGLAFAAAVGLSREYPEIRLEDKLTPAGWRLYNDLKGACTARLIALGAMHSVPEVLKGGDLFAEKELMDAFRRNSIIDAAEPPDVPVYMWHSRTDPLVPFWDAETVARRYCAQGVALDWQPAAAPEHLLAAVEKLPDALHWLDERLAGVPAPRSCTV